MGNLEIDSRIQYALGVLLDSSSERLFEWPEWLNYGRPKSGHRGVTIVASGFFGGDYGLARSSPVLPLRRIQGTPVLFGVPSMKRHGDELVVGADIVASAFFLLTRYEEWIRPGVRDEHGRFPGRESLPFRGGFIDRPIVDEYSSLLREWARQMGVQLPRRSRRFSVLLTHDVDSMGPPRGPLRAAKSMVRGLLGRSPWREAAADVAASLGLRRHADDNLESVIELDQRLTRNCRLDRCRSIFFFMAGGSSKHDGSYRLDSARVLERMHHLERLGAGVGLHASYEAGGDPAHVSGERARLEEAAGLPIIQNRHHFLRWREPEHGAAIAGAGLEWDSTMGYADAAGFRLGVCHPIPLFDPASQSLIGIEEHPLIVMDCTLDRPNYMNLTEVSALNYVQTLIDATYRHQGEFVCLWHNTVLADSDATYHRRLYPRVLDYLAERLMGAETCALASP